MTFSKTLSTFFITTMLMLCLACLPTSRNASLIENGNQIAVRIDAYKSDNGRLPSNLNDIGIEEKEEGPIYYQKQSDSKYILWFGDGLGESITYDSESNKWQPINKDGPDKSKL